MKRVTFVKGELTDGSPSFVPSEGFVACGDGTYYPIEVTLDQVAEIWFRVKDARLIEGSVLVGDTGTFPTIWGGLDSPKAVKENRAFSTTTYPSGEFTTVRGYAATGAISEHDVAYLGDPYPANLEDPSVEYRDIADNERGMWTVQFSKPNNTDPFVGSRNAFTLEDDTTGSQVLPSSTEYYVYFFKTFITSENVEEPILENLTPTGGYVQLSFGGVAVLKEENKTRYFLGFRFYSYMFDSVKWNDDFGLVSTEVVRYVIKLSNNIEVSCPIYYLLGPDELVHVSYNFIHEATEWWPYAKNSPATPVWESETGIKIPDDAIFWDLNNPEEGLAFTVFF
jgi:hypothetical protein